MRTLLACSAAAALVAAGGCLGDGGNVTLTFDQQSMVSPAITNFNGTNGTANATSDGFVHFTATSGQDHLTMDVIMPLDAGSMVDLMTEHNFLSYDTPGAGWSSNGGMIAIDGVNPYKLRFLQVPMLSGSGSAKGSFVINGSGTFK